ncbi:MAG: polysaccharide deacetylase family protein [Burkholderiaceae bacterium]|jgi:peptidoglycan/xylan/chitin deacetylase (PgdA/CDA1 family)|nr:polysaccharide deacetylase family protein [Burkholderiaceae bacterium]
MLSVLITVDTESYAKGNPQAQIWGRAEDGQEYGIRRIMDVLERHGARGTFYVNVYESGRHGEEPLREVVRTIHERGHDVELHTHPRDLYGIDKLTRADVPRQHEILAWGKAFIESETGQPVVAHRAGAFAANTDTVTALRELGIPVDASLSTAWWECHLAKEVPSPNRPFVVDGILELPATVYVQARLGARRFVRMVDIQASSLLEMKSVVRQAVAQNVSAVNLLVHSHSFVHDGRGDTRLLRRLDRFLAYLAREPGVQAETTRAFHARYRADPLATGETAAFEPYTGWWLTYLRAVESIGRGWKTTVAALAPPVAVATAGVVAYMWR